MFRMSKKHVFALANVLKPHVQQHNTKYMIVISLIICIVCILFNLTHGTNLIICSEMFAIDKSTMSMLLHDVVYAINDSICHQITRRMGERL